MKKFNEVIDNVVEYLSDNIIVILLAALAVQKILESVI